jgi:hypothetical protein
LKVLKSALPVVTSLAWSGAPPVLVTVTIIGALLRLTVSAPKLKLVVLNASDGVADVPKLISGMTRGLPGELSVMVTVPVRTPDPWGVKVTDTRHEAPAARLAPQALLLSVNSPGAPPT